MHLKRADLCPEKYPTTEHYPFNLNIFHETKSILFDSPVTFFVGENSAAVTQSVGRGQRLAKENHYHFP